MSFLQGFEISASGLRIFQDPGGPLLLHDLDGLVRDAQCGRLSSEVGRGVFCLITSIAIVLLALLIGRLIILEVVEVILVRFFFTPRFDPVNDRFLRPPV